MNENQAKPNNLVDTTDCLEAVGVFRGWKNFLFLITILCLLLLQACFWLVNTGYIKADDDTKAKIAVATTTRGQQTDEPAQQAAEEKAKIDKAAEPDEPAPLTKERGEPAKSAVQQPKPQQAVSLFNIKFEQLAQLIRFLNFVLILASALYCLTMLFSLKVSLLGRLGGINHICRAFFLSLAFVVLLLPWQKFFAGVVVGAMYTPQELSSCAAVETRSIFSTGLYYLRFTGYWLVVLLLLIFSQLRSSRWAKAILRRLEVI